MRVILVLASTLLSLILIEIVLRTFPRFELAFRDEAPLTMFSHPRYGWKCRPHTPYRWTREGCSSGVLNSAGWRDREHAIPKPPGTFRVLVLGDSFVEAVQVDYFETFHHLLEIELGRRRPGMRVEVLAMGVSGYSTAQELNVYLDEGRTYEPDIVLLMFTIGNDFVGNSKELSSHGGQQPLEDDAARRPYYELRGNRLIQDPSFRRTPEYLTRLDLPAQRFLVDDLIRNAAWRIRHGELDLGSLWQEPVPGAIFNPAPLHPPHLAWERVDAIDPSCTYHIFRDPMPDLWKPAVELTGALIGELRRSVEADGHRLVVVSIPTNLEVHREAMQEEFEATYWMSGKPAGMRFDLEQARRQLDELAKRHSFVHLPLVDAFREDFGRTGQSPFGIGKMHGWGHFNARGHRLVADRLCEKLISESLVPGSGRDQGSSISR